MNLQNAAFIALLTVVTLAFAGLLMDFAMPIFWAATLAVIFAPLQSRVLGWLRGRQNIAALLTLFIICISVLLPLWFVLTAFASEAAALYARVEGGELNPDKQLEWLRANLPVLLDALGRVGITPEELESWLSSAAIAGSQFMGSLAISAGQNAVRFTVMFVLMLYTLFFLLRDGDVLIEYLIQALPIGDERERALLSKFAEVSRATIKGTLVIGIVQGTLGGLIFWALDIQGAVFWGCVMVLLSLVPVVGASLVWAPAAIGLALNGEAFSAAVLVLFGVVVIGLMDNILRPVLVGRDTRMPDYLVLFSTLGGLTVFGASGFVIGPVIAALFLTMWVMFAREFNGHDMGAD